MIIKALKNLWRAIVGPKTETTTVTPRPMRRRIYIPRSSFTKKGPGVVARMRSALSNMTRAERLYCKRKGWDRGLVTPKGGIRGD